MQNESISASDALERLKKGNQVYLSSQKGVGDISPERRTETSVNGQKPYAVIITCSDSRVIPEYIFSAGIGELFVIRVAGNVIDHHALGSIEYAVEHLHCKLLLVLGHTQCGAIGAAGKPNGGYVKYITDEISLAVGRETDKIRASVLNVKHSVAKAQKLLKHADGLLITGALYHTDSGAVDFDIGL